MTLGNIGGSIRAMLGTRRRSHVRQFQPRLGQLEGRELKDGGISLIAGTISIEGTAAQDSVEVYYPNPTHDIVAVTWNNTTANFNRADVSGIRFDGRDGFNLFDNLTDLASTALGDDGTNVFVGASGNDTFLGGDGFNYFWVAPGHNTLAGGNGINFFLGVSDDDSVTVGGGFNFIIRSS
jgi:Ca2+-binding RTX toxin-like protein